MKKFTYSILFFSFLFLGFTLLPSTLVNAQRRYSEREDNSNNNHSRHKSNNNKAYHNKSKHNSKSNHRSHYNKKADRRSHGNSRYYKHGSHKNYSSHSSSHRSHNSHNSYRYNRQQHANVGHYYSNRARCYDHSNYGRVVVDFGYEPLVIRSRDCDYYYNEGNYYQYRNEVGYIRVSEPYETRFYSLPDNCNSYVHRGRSYYVSGDIFFRRFGDHYRIVKRPLGINISFHL